MRASRPRDQNSHCFRCYLRREICICPVLPTVRTQTEFLILRHIGEANRPGNTGRLAALALPNSRIILCGSGDLRELSPSDMELLRAPGTWLLWPDGSGTQPDTPGITPPRRVVVLDATWRQARRLYSRMPVLRTMPRLALPAPARCRKRLREQQRADGMATIEAVAAALTKLEGIEVAEPLERLYDEVVRRRTSQRWGIRNPDHSEKMTTNFQGE